eukprot:TRINITY_DN5981_c0_g1_i1.p1 TRINITY_DN5981_c0_g1~~TRINITY_DN5981_c0_g1_i1.p1  ORF type:complete len:325 (+),score=69.56 TRINITY_DN5981_c0_g1_i1:115-1089(+)
MSIVVVGSSNRDYVSFCESIPRVGETVKARDLLFFFGGKGANQAVQAARLGGKVYMVSKLGNDPTGKETIENFASNNVDTKHILTTSSAPSGTAFITVDKNGNNSIVVVGGSNDLLVPGEIEKAEVYETIKNAHVLLCQLEIPIPVTIAALKAARENGVLTVLNTAPILPNMPDELFKYVDILCVNETELEKITGKSVETMEQIQSAANYLLYEKYQSIEFVVITLGGNGCAYMSKHSRDLEHIKMESKVEVVDTTAAGDSFIGSLAFFLSLRKDKKIESLSHILKKANVIASFSVQHKGAQSSLGYRKEFSEDFLKKKKFFKV